MSNEAGSPPPGVNITSTRFSAKQEPILNERRHRQRRAKLMKRVVPLLLTLPYILGLLWTALHPLVSVITGELKCRGHYIDENGLDVHRHKVKPYPLERKARTQPKSTEGAKMTGLCDALKSVSPPISPSVECLRYPAMESVTLDIARILPSLGPMIEPPEAIVIILGPQRGGSDNQNLDESGDWYSMSDLHASIINLVDRLGKSEDCPWLTKTVLLVAPAITTSKNETSPSSHLLSMDLATVVDSFMISYFGPTYTPTRIYANVNSLPPEFTFAMIRSVLVLHDAPPADNLSSGLNTEIRVLPQGAAGSLPNLDLVFATFFALKSQPEGSYHPKNTLYHSDTIYRAHPYGSLLEKRFVTFMERWGLPTGEWIENILHLKDGQVRSGMIQYASDLAGWFGFMAALVVSPPQPHASILNRGIDSLTIELRIPPQSSSKRSSSSSIHPYYADFARCIEHLLHSISNLHERLHHSISQYTLPSSSKFVSHGEYIYPAILVSLPMIVQAATLALRDISRFQFQYVGRIMGAVCVATSGIGLWVVTTNNQRGDSYPDGRSVKMLFLAAYLFVVGVGRHKTASCCIDTDKANLPKEQTRETKKENVTLIESLNSLRFMACLLGVYLHAPLLLSNYPLGFPSSAFWSPLLGTLALSPMPLLQGERIPKKISVLISLITGSIKILFLVTTSPPIFLVPGVFPCYTPYILTVYVPLHLILASLWLVSVRYPF